MASARLALFTSVKALYFRPQTKFAKVMFLDVSVILSTGGCLLPGGLSAPVGVSAPGESARGLSAPGGACSWGGGACSGGCLVETPWDGYCCRQYASYWNACLLQESIPVGCVPPTRYRKG